MTTASRGSPRNCTRASSSARSTSRTPTGFCWSSPAGDGPWASQATSGTNPRPRPTGPACGSRPEAQYDAVCTWGIPDHALLQRLSCLQMPVFVANGDSDPMILPHYSYLLAGLIPQARLKIYPDSAHGFLFQHHAQFAADVEAFLNDRH